VSSAARTSIECDENDVNVVEHVLFGSNHPQGRLLKSVCLHYHRSSPFCANTTAIEQWLFLTLLVVGGIALTLSFSGAVCMLYMFVTRGSVRKPSTRRPLFVSVNKLDRKTLIHNMEA